MPRTRAVSPRPAPNLSGSTTHIASRNAPTYLKARFISDKVGKEECEASRREWAEVTWPSILRKAKASGAVILFIDEASFAMWGSLARTP